MTDTVDQSGDITRIAGRIITMLSVLNVVENGSAKSLAESHNETRHSGEEIAIVVSPD